MTRHPSVEPLRVAIIGTGFIGRVHARSARVAGGHLIAVAASNRDRSNQAADEMGASGILDGPEDLAGRSDIDVVHVCTPNNLHETYVRAALESGKHVVCEKPLAMRSDAAAGLADLASHNGAVATVPFVYRFYPTVREARRRTLEGEIGDLRLIHGSYLQDWLSRRSDWTWRVDPEIGGPSRAMADIGSHWCDLAEFVTGHRITRLVAKLDTTIPERDAVEYAASFSTSTHRVEAREVTTEDVACVLFQTDHGTTGSLVVSQVSPGRKNRLWIEVDGSLSALSFNQEEPDQLWVGGRDETSLVMRQEASLGDDAQRYSILPGGHPQGYNDSFDLFVRDTYQAIRGDKPDGLPTFEDGLRAMRIVDAVLASVASEDWEEVGS